MHEECTRGDQDRLARDAERARQWRARNREKSRALAAQARKDHPERLKAGVARWRAKNPEHYRTINRVSHAVRSAIKRGILVRSSVCEECGRSDRAIDAAHYDYSRPLEVRWLCRSCHSIWDHAQPKTR